MEAKKEKEGKKKKRNEACSGVSAIFVPQNNVCIVPFKREIFRKSHKIVCLRMASNTYVRFVATHILIIVIPVSGRRGYRWHLSRHDEHGVHSVAPGHEWESARCKKLFFLNALLSKFPPLLRARLSSTGAIHLGGRVSAYNYRNTAWIVAVEISRDND